MRTKMWTTNLFPARPKMAHRYRAEHYQKGPYALIPIHWDEGAKTLSIGDRKGQYPGMPVKRLFNIVWVSQGHGVGEAIASKADKVVSYDGRHISIKMP